MTTHLDFISLDENLSVVPALPFIQKSNTDDNNVGYTCKWVSDE